MVAVSVEPFEIEATTRRGDLVQTIQNTAIKTRCLKREEQPSNLVGAAFVLASPDADFITGQTIIVDGGNEML